MATNPGHKAAVKQAERLDENLPDGWQDWPMLREAANLIGLTPAKLSGYVKVGAIKKYVAPNQTGSKLASYRFDPADLNRLEDLIADEEEQEKSPTTADTVRASNEGQKIAQEHVQRLVTLFEEPYKFVLTALREENAALRAELKVMRDERAAFDVQREASRSQQALEAVALEEMRGEQKTKQEALDLAKTVGGYFLKKKMVADGVDPRLIALQEAVASIPRESFEVLFKMGVLPPDAEQKLKLGLNWKDEPASAEASNGHT